MAEINYSLRRRLLILLLGAVGTAWLVVAGLGYAAAHHEADELFDAQLANIAQTLLAIVRSGESESIAEIDEHIHEYQLNLPFQVWRIDDGRMKLLLRRSPAPFTPLAEQPGFNDVYFDGEHWRVLGVWGEEYVVFVAQHHGVREELATNISVNLLLPMAFGLPLLGIALWLSVRRGFAPLRRLARDVEKREPDSLAPLWSADVPAEVLPLVEALNALFSRVIESFERERRFTADAAHELRTPLAAIRVQAQVALESTEENARRVALKNLIAGIDRQAHLVDQLLTLSRLDAAAELTDIHAVDLYELVEDALVLLNGETRRLEVKIDVRIPPETYVQGDRELLGVLLRNLLSNAMRYGGSPGQIIVDATMENRELSLCVTDNGAGIPEELRDQVSARFTRLPSATEPGSGLGLSIVLRIASLHRAALELRDSPTGTGLRACVRFPLM